jgi:hypothetical protein
MRTPAGTRTAWADISISPNGSRLQSSSQARCITPMPRVARGGAVVWLGRVADFLHVSGASLHVESEGASPLDHWSRAGAPDPWALSASLGYLSLTCMGGSARRTNYGSILIHSSQISVTSDTFEWVGWHAVPPWPSPSSARVGSLLAPLRGEC